MQLGTIEVDETRRIVIHQDDHPDSPREWQEGCSVFEVNRNTRYLAPDEGENTHEAALAAILEQLGEERYGNGGGDYTLTDAAEEAIAKHFDRAGLYYRIVEHHSGRDWVGVFIWYVEDACQKANTVLGPAWNPADFIDSCVAEYEAWAEGSVYGVGLENRVMYAAVTDPDDTLEAWVEDSEVDILWGIITTDENDLRTSAADAFGIPLDQIGHISWH